MDKKKLADTLLTPLEEPPKTLLLRQLERMLLDFEKKHNLPYERDKMLEVLTSNDIKAFTDITEKLKCPRDDFLSYMTILNTWATIYPAQVFFLTQKFCMKHDFDIPINEDLYLDFKLPFPEIMIAFEHAQGGCMPFFLSLFSMAEKIKIKDELQTLYCCKIMICTENFAKTMEERLLKSPYINGFALLQFYFTAELLPRIYLECPCINNCPQAIIKNLWENSYINSEKASTDLTYARQCLKSVRTSKSCPELLGPIFSKGFSDEWLQEFAPQYIAIKKILDQPLSKTEPTTRVEQAYQTLKIALITIKKFMEKPARIKKVLKIQGEYEKHIKENKKRYKSRYDFLGGHLIRFTDKNVYYSDPGAGKQERKGTHQPPCEHVRRGHVRICKSGKKVFVRETIVNKGKKKTIILK